MVNAVNEVATRYLTGVDPNAITQISLFYDAAGNLMGDEEFAYYYDALSRLRSVYTITGVALLHIKYDALGRAVERQVGQNGPVTYYVYDVPTPGGPNGYAVAQEYDDDDNLLREFIHRNGHLRPVAMVDYTDAGAISAGLPETFWYLYDERGSVIAITDNAGIVVEQYRYGPYGGATVYDGAGAVVATWSDPNSRDDAALTPSLIGNPYGFTGHRFSVAGLYETPFRAYSPELGRWLQRDPLGYVDGMNLYQYVVGNPLLFFDPFGLISKDIVKLGDKYLVHTYDNSGNYVSTVPYDAIVENPGGTSGGYGEAVEAAKEHNKASVEVVASGATALADNADVTMVEGLVLTGGAVAGASLEIIAAARNGFRGSRAPSCPTTGKGPKAPRDAGEPKRINSARVLARQKEEPGPYHNFPESFNDVIFKNGTREVLSEDYIQYTYPGTINGRTGTYQIGVKPMGRAEIVTHRFFSPDRGP